MSAVGYPEPSGEYTAGHSGSDTSRERALTEARDGTKAKREMRVLGFLLVVGTEGLTVRELREITGWHHGQASAALSTLHKAGKIDRLTERRDKCLVYTHPEYTGDRQTSPYHRNRATAQYGPWSAWREKLVAAAETPYERVVAERLIARVIQQREEEKRDGQQTG